MSELVPLALYGWLGVGIVLFALLSPRSALLATMLGAWLFLPAVRLESQGFLDFDRRVTASLAALAGVALFDARRALAFRPRWLDAPMFAWCMAPFCASLANDLGAYDGFVSVLGQLLRWGVPYFLGRIYLSSPAGLAALARATFIGGLLYAPLCLWEVRMSPTLHRYVYGIEVYGGIKYFSEFGAWGSRPSVFLANPLELGMFMSAACLCGLALVLAGRPRRTLTLPTGLLLLLLVLVTLLGKNLGATLLLLVGTAVLFALVRWRAVAAFVLLVGLAPSYALLRGSGLWSARQIVDAAALLHAGRAQSFEFRLDNEDILLEKALERPVFGWGGWGRSRVYDEQGRDVSVTDGTWVIALGTTGLFGLASLLAALALPVLAAGRRIGASSCSNPLLIPAVALAVLMALFTVDCLFNDFPNPLFLLGLGGLAGLPRVRAMRRRPSAPASRDNTRRGHVEGLRAQAGWSPS